MSLFCGLAAAAATPPQRRTRTPPELLQEAAAGGEQGCAHARVDLPSRCASGACTALAGNARRDALVAPGRLSFRRPSSLAQRGRSPLSARAANRAPSAVAGIQNRQGPGRSGAARRTCKRASRSKGCSFSAPCRCPLLLCFGLRRGLTSFPDAARCACCACAADRTVRICNVSSAGRRVGPTQARRLASHQQARPKTESSCCFPAAAGRGHSADSPLQSGRSAK